MDKSALKLKYHATVKGILIFYALLLLAIGLQVAKLIPTTHTHFRTFFSHTSNFIITTFLTAIISLIWLLQGAPFKYIVWLGVVAIALNFIVELFVTFMNTPDVVDAVYGSAGVIICVLTMFVIKKVGLQQSS